MTITTPRWAGDVPGRVGVCVDRGGFISPRASLFATVEWIEGRTFECEAMRWRMGEWPVTGMVDTVGLSRLWDERWPGCSKLPYELRGVEDRWVRFHTLPGSKRYPDTETEYEIILARHNSVLTELVAGSALLVVTAGYSDRPEPEESCRSTETVAVHPDGRYWTSVCLDDDPGFEIFMHLYVSQAAWSVGCLDPLLRHVADDVISNVLVADVGLRWLYHPYDGGMDVLLSSTAERDAVQERYRDWLSAHPLGL